ncbi:MAG: hypothetical protein A2Y73_08620 [Chloroflexi bacterium RBG_13_56_8]|nr:MAG: hypothetical protein A2Y73_08620 [Chloroflexi bacterium RBG_13_56_8]
MLGDQGQIKPRRSLDGLRMYMVRQRWQQPDIRDIGEAVASQLTSIGALDRVAPGDEIAITAGSRGIASMLPVLHAVIGLIKERGGEPFIFPAMGSHGGGTAEGQIGVLAGMGIDDNSMGVPIRASMDVVQLTETEEGLPVYLDAVASKADGIIMVNRIKKHTNFDGDIESGLCKMAVIGMGKHAEAVAVHQLGNAPMSGNIVKVAKEVFSRAKILGGLAILENARGGLAELVGLRADEILEREPALLKRAKELCAKIPFHKLDIALVEQMGKDISGTGMDCYVIGRKRIIGEPEWPETPEISSLVVLDLTETSHGNAVGVGLADFTTRRLADKIDWVSTSANVLTSRNLERGKLPLTLATDREALETASFRERATPMEELRVACMHSTLHLRDLLVSEPLAELVRESEDLEVTEGPLDLPFDAEGNWVSPFEKRS